MITGTVLCIPLRTNGVKLRNAKVKSNLHLRILVITKFAFKNN